MSLRPLQSSFVSTPRPAPHHPPQVTARPPSPQRDDFQAATAKAVARLAATAAPHAVSLQRGMEGPEVRAWQQKLVQLGYLTQAQMDTGPGIFGPQTEAATRSFQADHGLNVSGHVGSGTRREMKKALEAQRNAPPPSTLQRGMEGPQVRAWQQQLVQAGYLTQAQMDTGPGIFGPQTEAATRAFQADHGLNPSGQVGSGTRREMKKALGGDSAHPPGSPVEVRNISQLYSDGTADDWNRLSNCGPTTVAMIAKAFGFHATDWRDGTLVDWLAGQGGVGAAGAGYSQVQQMARAAGLSASEPMIGSDLDWVRAQLAAGNLVAANGDRGVTLAHSSYTDGVTGGHWIVIKGVDENGNFLVEDPSTDCKVLSPSELQRYFDSREGGGVAVAIGP